jgi:phage shock protein PspC (stress-responsive transcriptional regulator)
MTKKLYRTPRGKIIGGVCVGLAEYFDIDAVLIRALFVVALFSGGVGLITYIVLWVIMPQEENVLSAAQTAESPSDGAIDKSEDESFFSEKNKGSVIIGLVLLALGTFFLVRELFPSFSFKYVLPLMLITIGAIIVFNAIRKNFNAPIE